MPVLTVPLPAKQEPPAWIKSITQATKRPTPPLEVLVSRSLNRVTAEQFNQINQDTFPYQYANYAQLGQKETTKK
jgi:hypothetical protein